MSRQLRFYHNEQDARALLALLENLDVCFAYEDRFLQKEETPDFILESMRAWHYQFKIVPAAMAHLPAQDFEYWGSGMGMYVEFLNCYQYAVTEGNREQFMVAGRTEEIPIYTLGRIYIERDSNNVYIPDVLCIYQKLLRYFKKNYRYDSEQFCYWGPNLISACQKGGAGCLITPKRYYPCPF